jgi:hypothetical protein
MILISPTEGKEFFVEEGSRKHKAHLRRQASDAKTKEIERKARERMASVMNNTIKIAPEDFYPPHPTQLAMMRYMSKMPEMQSLALNPRLDTIPKCKCELPGATQNQYLCSQDVLVYAYAPDYSAQGGPIFMAMHACELRRVLLRRDCVTEPIPLLKMNPNRDDAHWPAWRSTTVHSYQQWLTKGKLNWELAMHGFRCRGYESFHMILPSRCDKSMRQAEALLNPERDCRDLISATLFSRLEKDLLQYASGRGHLISHMDDFLGSHSSFNSDRIDTDSHATDIVTS